MLTDPAMLFWLDGQKNTATAPNENLSREFMELFTLGHGDGYTETGRARGGPGADRLAARPRDGTADLVPERHDDGSKTVLGVTGNLDATGFCDACSRPAGLATFRGARIWSGSSCRRHRPTPRRLDRLVAAYGPSRGLAALLTAMLTGRGVHRGRSGRSSSARSSGSSARSARCGFRSPTTRPQEAAGACCGRSASCRSTRPASAAGRRGGLAVHRGGRRPDAAPRPHWPARPTWTQSRQPPPAGSTPSATCSASARWSDRSRGRLTGRGRRPARGWSRSR